MNKLSPPRGLLLDYGGTLVEEVGYDLRAANELVFSRAVGNRGEVTLEMVIERANLVSAELSELRERSCLEVPWPAQTSLIYDYFGMSFREPMAKLEMDFWNAAAITRPMPGSREALTEFARRGIPMGVVSNCAFAGEVIRQELAKHNLAEHLAFVMVSAEYAVRKPNRLLFDAAARRLGVSPGDIWFVGDRLDTDVEGAKAAEMTSVWLRPAESGPSNEPDLSVASWEELLEHLPR